MKNLNTPNKITLLRFLFTFIIIGIYSLEFIPGYEAFAPELGTTGFNWIDLVCAVLFILGSVTDAIDGHLARSRNLITDLGKFMDPLADKFLVDAAFILLTTKMLTTEAGNVHHILLPIITVFIVARDLAMDGLRILANSKGRVLAANIYGKIKTAMEMGLIPVLFLGGFPFSYFNFNINGHFEYTYIITNILATLTLGMSLVSCVIYFIQNKDIFKEDKENGEN